jgi:hypothetical protein
LSADEIKVIFISPNTIYQGINRVNQPSYESPMTHMDELNLPERDNSTFTSTGKNFLYV